MRYRVHSLFWTVLESQQITVPALSEATGTSSAALYRVRSGTISTVSPQFRERALALFPADMCGVVASMFTPVGEDRFTVKPRFWGILAERRIKLAVLGPQIGVTEQRMSHMRLNPTATIPESAMRLACERLEIEPAECFELVANPRSPRIKSAVALAS